MSRWFRFGNSVIQLRNAIYLAEQLGIHVIETVSEHPFFQGRTDTLDFKWNTREDSGPTIEGEFFFLDAFSIHKIDRVAEARIFRHHLRKLVTSMIRKPDSRVGENDLVIHLRAGDVFNNPTPHPFYGQPPLSYYLSIVQREQPSSVWLVFEDRGNPCIDALESMLSAKAIRVQVQSGTLADDIRVLMSAKRLVASYGSFVPMIALLSNQTRFVYFFGKGDRYPLPELGVDVGIVVDVQGDYKADIMNGNWRGSDAQRRLMLEYPVESLAFRKVKPAR